MKRFQRWMVCLALLGLMVLPVLAANEENSGGLRVQWVEGPTQVTMGEDLSTVQVPEKFIFANGQDTRALMEHMGNSVSDQEIGFVAPADENAEWFIIFEYDPMGYVKDDDADKIDADGLLQSIREGTEARNEEIKGSGIPALHVVGWQDPPHYDKATHNLVWSLLARDDAGNEVINYNTRVLGREGVTSVTLVVDPKNLDAIKPELSRILDSYRYKEGKRYSDFIAGKDKIAEVGLTALVAGGVGAAAAKTGLLGKIFGPILALLAKFWYLAVAAVGALLARLRSVFNSSD